jgi:hypothetical protein
MKPGPLVSLRSRLNRSHPVTGRLPTRVRQLPAMHRRPERRRPRPRRRAQPSAAHVHLSSLSTAAHGLSSKPIHFLLLVKLCCPPLLLCCRSALLSATPTRSRRCSSPSHRPSRRSCASFLLERSHPQAAAPSIAEAKTTIRSHRCRGPPAPAFHDHPPGKPSKPRCSPELRAPHRPGQPHQRPLPRPLTVNPRWPSYATMESPFLVSLAPPQPSKSKPHLPSILSDRIPHHPAPPARQKPPVPAVAARASPSPVFPVANGPPAHGLLGHLAGRAKGGPKGNCILS